MIIAILTTMKKIKTAQSESQSKRRITFSRLEVFSRGRRSAATQQQISSTVESVAQGEKSVDRLKKLHDENTSKSPEELYQSVVFPQFPCKFLNCTSEDFALPEEYFRDQKNETVYPELMSLLPEPDVKIQFGKENVNNSDLADTVPVEDIPSSLLKMSSEKTDNNLPDTRAVSPILLRKCTTARSHLHTRRMKSLNSSVRSKRPIPKQIPLVLDHEVMTKINENLPELSQIDNNADWRKKQEDSVSLLNETDTDNDFFHLEKISQLSEFEYHTLKANNGRVLAVFYEYEVVIVVQDFLITFLSINEQNNRGEVARSEIQSSVNWIFTSNVSSNESLCACMEMMLVSQRCEEEQQLMVSMYTFNQVKGISHACSVNLLKLPMHVSNLKMCPVQDCGFVACWSKDKNISTQIVKYTMDNRFEAVLKSTELDSVNGCVNSLHALRGCQKVIVGATTSGVTIWDLHSGHVLKTVDFEGLVWSSYLWCDEDKGFLFSALGIDKSIQITAANLTTGKFKVLRQYSVPEPFSQLSELHVQHDLVTAVSPEGFIVWELGSSKTILKASADLQLFLCKSNLICISCNRDTSVIVLRVLDIRKLK